MVTPGGNFETAAASPELDRVESEYESAQFRFALALADASTVDMVASAVAAWGARASAAQFVNLAVFNPETNAVRAVHADSLDRAVAARWSEFSIGSPTPLCDAILSGAPVLLPSLDFYRQRYSNLLEDTVRAGLKATASLPLPAGDGTSLGAVGFGWSEPQEFGARQVAQLRLVAELAAHALRRVSAGRPAPLDVGHATARALQETFLPSIPAHAAGLKKAAAYLPANAATMGGDWFDVFPVEGGTCLVVGDIGGHGLQAAALMAEVRSAIRAFASYDPDPAVVVRRTNRMLCQLHPDATATLVVGVWNPVARTWVRCNAGHPPSLLCRRGGCAYLSSQHRNVLLGADPAWDYRAEAEELHPDTTLLMYTDGLVEVGSQGITAGMDALLDHVEDLPDLSPHAVVDDVLLWRLSRGAAADDIALLAVQME